MGESGDGRGDRFLVFHFILIHSVLCPTFFKIGAIWCDLVRGGAMGNRACRRAGRVPKVCFIVGSDMTEN
jgi:hypothetical protein